MNDLYLDLIEDKQVEFKLKGPWAIVEAGRRQSSGWKLHLSSIPVQARQLLRLVVPHLVARSIPFKFAKDAAVLELLNAGRLGPTQVGKFMTIYPDPDRVRQIADELVALTQGFEGPVVPTDLGLGNVVYARFGPFASMMRVDRMGIRHQQVRLPDGQLCDDVYKVPHQAPTGVTSPFAHVSGVTGQVEMGLFGPGYRLLGVLREAAKGSTFLGLYLQCQEQVSAYVIKQGRKHCMSDRYGRDMRWRLQRERDHYKRLSGVPGLARLGEYFEVGGDGYLSVEFVDGDSIEVVVDNTLRRRPWSCLLANEKASLLRLVRDLMAIVAAIHERGLIHRDISPSNVIVDETGTLFLLDLEMAHAIDDPGPLAGSGTPGFAAPVEEDGALPDFADDVYSVTCILVLVVTGLDPRRVLHAMTDGCPERLSSLTGDAVELVGLIACIEQALASDPRRRPPLSALTQATEQALATLDLGPPSLPSIQVSRWSAPSAEDTLTRGLRGFEAAAPKDHDGRWLFLPIDHDEAEVSASDLEAARSVGRGAAGVLYVLARATRAGRAGPDLAETARGLAHWIANDNLAVGDALLGLHCGLEGEAVALKEAIEAGLVSDRELPDGWMTSRLCGAADWPDIVHGAAGQGVAALICAPTLSHRYADFLVETQDSDGSWAIPPGFAGLSGQKLTGFAHGVAGIVYFLADYEARYPDGAVRRAWETGADWLLGRLTRNSEGFAEWPYSDRDAAKWRWWCHGSGGIALCLMHLAELSGRTTYLDTALNALSGNPHEVRHGNLTQCHGLSGLGEVYLEAYRITGDDEWRTRAGGIASTIGVLARRMPGGGLTWSAGTARCSTPELYLGTGGILHFLLRLVEGPSFASFPLLPAPTWREAEAIAR